MGRRYFGINFGTTNSAIAVADEHGQSRTIPIDWKGVSLDVFRSVLFYDLEEQGSIKRLAHFAGPAAIDAYLQAEGASGRFIQSIKSYLADPNFSQTSVFGTSRSIEDLIADILVVLKRTVEAQIGPIDGPVTVGRPARFVGNAAREQLALDRLTRAYRQAGFNEISFEFEPVAAAFHVESGLVRDELVLIGDFGGGTSDFCILRIGPGAHRRGDRAGDILAVSGIGIAGDSFDARIIEHAIAPGLGRDALFRGITGDFLPMPKWIYSDVAHWHRLAFLDRPQTRTLFREIMPTVTEPDAVRGLQTLIEERQGFRLSRAVEEVKVALSSVEETVLVFDIGPARIRRPVSRALFEQWIEPDLTRIDATVAATLSQAGLQASAIDRVYLTGGSSRIAAVRRRFADRFGTDRIADTDALAAVAGGLALSAWTRG
jgi:hypothetical chaperone protein